MNIKKYDHIKNLIRLATLLLLIISVFSCQKMDKVYSNMDRSAAYGIVIGDNTNAKILLDEEYIMLKIASYTTDPIGLKDGDRGFIIYSITGEDTDPVSSASTVYKAVIHDIKNILVKDYLVITEIDDEREAELGVDKTNISNAWISAGYLNINFYFNTANLPVSHFINLVLDNVNSTSKTKYLTFRHNAFEDIGTLQRFGRVSFDIKDIIDNMEPDSEIEFVLRWDSYLSDRNQYPIIYRKK